MKALVDQIFAITVPCYRSEHTIAETLRAISEQGEELQRLQCIVIADDASPDKTVEIARSVWPLSLPPLKFDSRRKNLGEMINVNMAVAGLPDDVEWFLHMHGDNIPKPGWLKTLTDRCLATDQRVGIVCASYDVLRGKLIEPGDDRPLAGPTLIQGNVTSIRDTIRRGCWWHNSCTAIRTRTFREVGGFPPGMRQKGDWDFLLRVLNAGWNIEYLPQTLMVYRLHDDTASGRAFRVHLDVEESLQVIEKYAAVLTIPDISYVHWINIKHLVRRLGRSLSRGDFERAVAALKMSTRTCAHWLSCLAA
jgi:GT2 family glycosyltransferase